MRNERRPLKSAPWQLTPGASLRIWRDQLLQYELLPILLQIEQITVGERAERIVGNVIDELQNEGYVGVHSIHRDGCDIDHVLIGPGGVFVIETKYRRGRGVITFRNGQGMSVGKRRCGDKAIEQAKSGACEVNRIVREECGLSEGVWPIVVFVGNWRVADQWDSTDARVFTPESLQGYVREQQPVLLAAEVERIAASLHGWATA